MAQFPLKLRFGGESRRVKADLADHACISMFDLREVAVRLFPALNATDFCFTYPDPEDSSTITMRLDDDVLEWLRLTPANGSCTLALTIVVIESEAIAGASGSAPPSSSVVHDAVICDDCGMSPITGVRFKCLVREDFDLCSACEAKTVQPFAMIKITNPEQAPAALVVGIRDRDSPAAIAGPAQWVPHGPMGPRGGPRGGWGWGRHGHRHGPPQGGPSFGPPPHGGHGPPFPPPPGGPPFPPSPHGGPWMPPSGNPPLMARFVRDDSYPDGTTVPNDTEFSKGWVIRNDGTTEWPAGTALRFVSGDEMAVDIPAVPAAKPGEEVVIRATLKAPPMCGRFVAYFRLVGPLGQPFGQRMWADIRCVDSAPATATATATATAPATAAAAASAPAPAPAAAVSPIHDDYEIGSDYEMPSVPSDPATHGDSGGRSQSATSLLEQILNVAQADHFVPILQALTANLGGPGMGDGTGPSTGTTSTSSARSTSPTINQAEDLGRIVAMILAAGRRRPLPTDRSVRSPSTPAQQQQQSSNQSSEPVSGSDGTA